MMNMSLMQKLDEKIDWINDGYDKDLFMACKQEIKRLQAKCAMMTSKCKLFTEMLHESIVQDLTMASQEQEINRLKAQVAELTKRNNDMLDGLINADVEIGNLKAIISELPDTKNIGELDS